MSNSIFVLPKYIDYTFEDVELECSIDARSLLDDVDFNFDDILQELRKHTSKPIQKLTKKIVLLLRLYDFQILQKYFKCAQSYQVYIFDKGEDEELFDEMTQDIKNSSIANDYVEVVHHYHEPIQGVEQIKFRLYNQVPLVFIENEEVYYYIPGSYTITSACLPV